MTATLVHISYSPWSEKARWALDHHRVAYRKQEYTLMLGEPALRLRLRTFARVSVPVLFTDEGALTDSWDIARYAERQGSGAPLFPPGRDDEVQRWNEVSQAISAAGRVRSTERLVADDEALLEAIAAAPVPFSWLGRAGLPMARQTARFIQRKYALDAVDRAAHLERMRDALARFEDALGDKDHVLGSFSYADITMAAAMQYVLPVEGFIRLGPAERRAWSEPELADRFRGLVAWRDRLYSRHR